MSSRGYMASAPAVTRGALESSTEEIERLKENLRVDRESLANEGLLVAAGACAGQTRDGARLNLCQFLMAVSIDATRRLSHIVQRSWSTLSKQCWQSRQTASRQVGR